MTKLDKFALLLSQAAAQGGYFTAYQARQAGYDYDDQHYQVAQGHWQRMTRGLYHLSGFPTAPDYDLIEWSLLSCDRTGVPQLVFSHETALRLHEFSEVNPASYTATVPSGFRKQLPPGIHLTRAHLAEGEWEERQGYRVTTPLRTLLDSAASPRSWPYLEEAIRDALQRGLVRRSELEHAPGTTRMRARLQAALRRLDRQPQERQKGAH